MEVNCMNHTANMNSTMDANTKAYALNSICKISRKRVRFDSFDESEERVKVQVVEVIRPSSEMSTSEKNAAWYQKIHFKGNLLSARVIAQEHGRRVQKHETELDYSDALASTYASCYLDESEHSVLVEHCAQHLAVATNMEKCSVEGESNRGLEKITVPEVGRETVRRRKEAIGSVILAQHAFHFYVNAGEKDEVLRNVSVEQSRCARKFAKALGTADAMSALLEYQATSPPWSSPDQRNTTAARVA